MSPHPHHKLTPASQRETASPTINAHHRREVRAITGPRRIVRQRIIPVVAALGVSLAATTALADSGAHASPRAVKADFRASALQPALEIDALRAEGYTPAACTRSGTLMRNYHTDQSAIVSMSSPSAAPAQASTRAARLAVAPGSISSP